MLTRSRQAGRHGSYLLQRLSLQQGLHQVLQLDLVQSSLQGGSVGGGHVHQLEAEQGAARLDADGDVGPAEAYSRQPSLDACSDAGEVLRPHILRRYVPGLFYPPTSGREAGRFMVARLG